MTSIEEVADADEHSDKVEGSNNISSVVSDREEKSSDTPQRHIDGSDEAKSAEASADFATSPHQHSSENINAGDALDSEGDASTNGSITDSTPEASSPAIVYKVPYRNIYSSDVVLTREAHTPLLVHESPSPGGTLS